MNNKDEKQEADTLEIKQETKIHGGDDDERTNYPGNPGDSVLTGVMSFAELDAIERAQGEQGKLSRIVNNFMSIVRNITQNIAIEPSERSAAIRDVTEEMRARLDANFERGERMISLPTVDGKIDSAYLRKLLKSDQVTKQTTKTEGGIQYRVSDYADVPDKELPSTWKLRLAESRSGNFTVAQVARAITAMQPSGFRGQRVELGQPKSTVANKINRVISGLSATDEQKENLQRRLNAVKTIDFTHHTGFKVLKAQNGDDRWLGWVSNKFMDREGEILTDDAHKDYIAFLNAYPKAAGELWTFHIPGTEREAKADFWAYLNGFLIIGGKLTEEEAKALDNYDGDLGMSHGFYVLEKEGNLIKKYRTFEYTVLPRNSAANLWTKFDVKEFHMEKLTDQQREMARQLHGDDFVSALESDTDKASDALDKAGVQSKADGDGNGSTNKATDFDISELTKLLVDAVTKELNFQGLQDALKSVHDQGATNATAIENIAKRLEVLEKTDDEKLAKEFEPQGIQWNQGFRASQDKKTVVTEQEKEKFEKAKPNEGWLAETGAFSLNGG